MTDTGPQAWSRIRATRMTIAKGAERYDGGRHLDRLLGGEADGWKPSSGDTAATIARLKRALRSQRQLGRAGHWSYDLNRHFGLLQALKAEIARSRAHTKAGAGENSAGAVTASGICDTGSETS